jgi:hypothetical protein
MDNKLAGNYLFIYFVNTPKATRCEFLNLFKVRIISRVKNLSRAIVRRLVCQVIGVMVCERVRLACVCDLRWQVDLLIEDYMQQFQILGSYGFENLGAQVGLDYVIGHKFITYGLTFETKIKERRRLNICSSKSWFQFRFELCLNNKQARA